MRVRVDVRRVLRVVTRLGLHCSDGRQSKRRPRAYGDILSRSDGREATHGSLSFLSLISFTSSRAPRGGFSVLGSPRHPFSFNFTLFLRKTPRTARLNGAAQLQLSLARWQAPLRDRRARLHVRPTPARADSQAETTAPSQPQCQDVCLQCVRAIPSLTLRVLRHIGWERAIKHHRMRAALCVSTLGLSTP